MTTLSQSVACVEVVKSVLGARFVAGTDVKSVITKEDRAEMITQLVGGFIGGEIQMSADARTKYSEEKALRVYCSGLLTNWLNKSKELNGGVKHEIKNPGSKSGSVELKQALALRKHFLDQGTEVPAELEAYIAENTPAKVEAKKELDLSALPEGLRNLIG
jgi:hypothetical protein